MRTSKGRSTLKPSVLAVRCALAAMAFAPAAWADPVPADAVTALTQPTNSATVGIGNVSQDSAKFGEYNGLYKKGAFGVLDLDIRGGAYGSDTDATRWKVIGNNLGLENRSLTGEYGQQGRFRLDFGFD